MEGFRRDVAVNDLCRREGIKPHSYYSWTKEFMEAGRDRLAKTLLAFLNPTRIIVIEPRA